jgi:hypothetical protein
MLSYKILTVSASPVQLPYVLGNFLAHFSGKSAPFSSDSGLVRETRRRRRHWNDQQQQEDQEGQHDIMRRKVHGRRSCINCRVMLYRFCVHFKSEVNLVSLEYRFIYSCDTNPIQRFANLWIKTGGIRPPFTDDLPAPQISKIIIMQVLKWVILSGIRLNSSKSLHIIAIILFHARRLVFRSFQRLH